MIDQDILTVNGVNGATGEYLLKVPSQRIAEVARREFSMASTDLRELRRWHQQTTEPHFGFQVGVDPGELSQAGWGLIMPVDADPAIREALEPLRSHRRSQAKDRYREFIGEDGYRPGETKQDFLARYGAGAGPVRPARVPYYLLIVGNPETISYSFQYQLALQYAVGRIHFESIDSYASYATSVINAEIVKTARPPRAVFFGPENPDDVVTKLTTSRLVSPLARNVEMPKGWEATTVIGEAATKKRLSRLLGGEETPALLFVASHGVGFPNGDPRQLPHQGALLCQDWPGPVALNPIPQEQYLSGDDISADSSLQGLIAFCVACFAAGTPRADDFRYQAFFDERASAPNAFLAQLPQRLLGNPSGGALALVGHVERVWNTSFREDAAYKQLATFERTMSRLLGDYPIGSALEYFRQRYAELSTDLNSELEELYQYGKKLNASELAEMWTANNDARSYTLIGDPAVRLRGGA
jgi:Peptidase family C25